MAKHSSILAWRVQWTEKPGSLQSQRVGHDWVTNKAKSKTVASEDSLISFSSQFLSPEAIAFWLYHRWLVLPVLGLHLNGNTLYVFCCVWVLSFNIISYLWDLHMLLIVMVAVPFYFWVTFHYINKSQFDYPIFCK